MSQGLVLSEPIAMGPTAFGPAARMAPQRIVAGAFVDAGALEDCDLREAGSPSRISCWVVSPVRFCEIDRGWDTVLSKSLEEGRAGLLRRDHGDAGISPTEESSLIWLKGAVSKSWAASPVGSTPINKTDANNPRLTRFICNLLTPTGITGTGITQSPLVFRNHAAQKILYADCVFIGMLCLFNSIIRFVINGLRSSLMAH